ncbi:gamma-glutamyl peptidase 5-like [Quillaja saponaria]|uniref:Gamma-glutamyl peptidase 5-like n=1 Tax=Quillaja saponaria TaxID=32244 RepID=A0AAD7P959_QUISA|nr:gamma-glutamyl peptidase 5-like [Quillaja saponaria]
MMAEEGETWDVYKVVSDEFPDDDEVGDYDGFVITGSCSDAHGNESWICKLVNLVKKLDSMRKKIMGICIGHQILCRALGGKTERSHTGWDIGVRTINLSSSALSFSFLQLPSKLAIIECHQDEVMELPDKAEVIAWSDKTEIEMFRLWRSHPGHPRPTPSTTKTFLLTSLTSFSNVMKLQRILLKR